MEREQAELQQEMRVVKRNPRIVVADVQCTMYVSLVITGREIQNEKACAKSKGVLFVMFLTYGGWY